MDSHSELKKINFLNKHEIEGDSLAIFSDGRIFLIDITEGITIQELDVNTGKILKKKQVYDRRCPDGIRIKTFHDRIAISSFLIGCTFIINATELTLEQRYNFCIGSITELDSTKVALLTLDKHGSSLSEYIALSTELQTPLVEFNTSPIFKFTNSICVLSPQSIVVLSTPCRGDSVNSLYEGRISLWKGSKEHQWKKIKSEKMVIGNKSKITKLNEHQVIIRTSYFCDEMESMNSSFVIFELSDMQVLQRFRISQCDDDIVMINAQTILVKKSGAYRICDLTSPPPELTEWPINIEQSYFSLLKSSSVSNDGNIILYGKNKENKNSAISSFTLFRFDIKKLRLDKGFHCINDALPQMPKDLKRIIAEYCDGDFSLSTSCNQSFFYNKNFPEEKGVNVFESALKPLSNYANSYFRYNKYFLPESKELLKYLKDSLNGVNIKDADFQSRLLVLVDRIGDDIYRINGFDNISKMKKDPNYLKVVEATKNNFLSFMLEKLDPKRSSLWNSPLR